MSFTQIMQLNIPGDVIDFGAGLPGVNLLPRTIMAQAAEHRWQQPEGVESLQYGANAGDGYFLTVLAQFLSKGYQMPVEPDDLFTTNGVSQALDAVCKFYTKPGDTIFIEEPTYFLALNIFRDYPLNIVSIPIDSNGLIIEALEEKLKEHKPAFLYTIPVFHNPAMVTLSDERRQALVQLSQKHGCLIIADEVYQLLHFDTPPPPPLVSYDEAGTVISVSSFSKILAPGLRLGWLHVKNRRLLTPFFKWGQIESGGGLNPLASGIVRSAIELGLQDQYLSHLKTAYRQHAAALGAAFRQHLPADFTFDKPEGGFFIWLRLPNGLDAETLLTQAAPYKVSFKPGPRFSSNGDLQQYARFCYAFYPEDRLVEGAERLAKAVSANQNTKSRVVSS